MVIYLVIFSISIALLILANGKNDLSKKYFIVASLAIPCVLAAIRYNTIGTDVNVYLSQMTEAAISSNGFSDYMAREWTSYWLVRKVSNYEIGFSILVYLSAKIIPDVHFVQFVLQVFTVVPIYLAIKSYYEEDCVYALIFGLSVYFLMFYNYSFNMMRQSIAMSLSLLAFVKYIKKEKVAFLFCTLLSVLFHFSSVIGFIVCLLYSFCIESKNEIITICGYKFQSRTVRMIMLVLVAVVGLMCLKNAVAILDFLGLTNYIGYINGDLSLKINQIIARLPLLLLVLYMFKNVPQNKNYDFYIILLIYDILFSQLASINIYASRISLYFSQFSILYLPQFFLTNKDQKLMILLTTSYLLVFWVVFFVIEGVGETVPFIIG